MTLTFESTHPEWSYVKMEGDLAIEVAENVLSLIMLPLESIFINKENFCRIGL